MGQVQFKQLNCYFRCTEPWSDDDPTPQSTFNRVNKLIKYIRLTYRKLYNPSTYLAVNKIIKRFIGRAPKIVNIPSKLSPKGFKIQVLVNKGYILNQLWHVRGDKVGLVNLDKTFTKEEGFLKTQVVVLNLLTQRNTELNKPYYPLGKYKGYYCGTSGRPQGNPRTPLRRPSVMYQRHVPLVYSLYDPRGLTSLRIRLLYNLSVPIIVSLQPPVYKVPLYYQIYY